jgi:hypothetical protein
MCPNHTLLATNYLVLKLRIIHKMKYLIFLKIAIAGKMARGSALPSFFEML